MGALQGAPMVQPATGSAGGDPRGPRGPRTRGREKQLEKQPLDNQTLGVSWLVVWNFGLVWDNDG